MKRCPFCAEEIQDAAIVCRHCGRDLNSTTLELPSSSPAQTAKKPRRRFIAYAVIAFVLLAALNSLIKDDEQTKPQDVAAPVSDQPGASSPNRAHAALLSASEAERARALLKMVQGVGESCDRITRIFHQGTERKSGDEMWNVACGNKNAFVISVKNDATGTTQVLSCAVLKAVTRVECFQKFQ